MKNVPSFRSIGVVLIVASIALLLAGAGVFIAVTVKGHINAYVLCTAESRTQFIDAYKDNLHDLGVDDPLEATSEQAIQALGATYVSDPPRDCSGVLIGSDQ